MPRDVSPNDKADTATRVRSASIGRRILIEVWSDGKLDTVNE